MASDSDTPRDHPVPFPAHLIAETVGILFHAEHRPGTPTLLAAGKAAGAARAAVQRPRRIRAFG